MKNNLSNRSFAKITVTMLFSLISTSSYSRDVTVERCNQDPSASIEMLLNREISMRDFCLVIELKERDFKDKTFTFFQPMDSDGYLGSEPRALLIVKCKEITEIEYIVTDAHMVITLDGSIHTIGNNDNNTPTIQAAKCVLSPTHN